MFCVVIAVVKMLYYSPWCEQALETLIYYWQTTKREMYYYAQCFFFLRAFHYAFATLNYVYLHLNHNIITIAIFGTPY